MDITQNKLFKQLILGNDREIIKRRRTELRPAFGGNIRENRLLPDSPNVVEVDTYWKIYKDEAPIRGAVKVIVNAACSTGWDVVTVDADDVDKEDPKVKDVINWFNNPTLMFNNVRRDLCLGLIIHDNSFAEVTKNKSKDKLGWIYPLDTRDCILHPPVDNETPGKLTHRVKGQSIKETDLKESKSKDRDVGQYIHIAMDKAGSAMGLSSIESLVRSADLLHSAYAYNQDLFDSNGVPALAFILEEGDGDDYEILVKATKTIKQGESFVAKGKIKVEVLGGKASEIGYEKLVTQVYQDVMTVFQVPPTIMSMPGTSTLESTREETSSFSMMIDAVQLILDNAVNRAIILIWGIEYSNIRFISKPWVNQKAQAAIDEIYLKWGVYTPNDVLKRMGLGLKWWGDVPYNINAPLGLGLESWGKPPKPDGIDMPSDWPEPPAEPTGMGGKPPGESGGGGRTGSTERPSEQGSQANPVKGLLEGINQLVSLAKQRESDIKALMDTNKNLTNIILDREKATAFISKQLDQE